MRELLNFSSSTNHRHKGEAAGAAHPSEENGLAQPKAPSSQSAAAYGQQQQQQQQPLATTATFSFALDETTMPAALNPFETFDTFLDAVLFYANEGLRDMRFTGLSLGRNRTFVANLKSIYGRAEAELIRLREGVVRLEEGLRREKESAARVVERSLAKEREMEAALRLSENSQNETREENERLKRLVADMERKLDVSKEVSERGDRVVRMLAEAHGALVQSNEMLLKECEELKAQRELDAETWKRTYEELRKRIVGGATASTTITSTSNASSAAAGMNTTNTAAVL